MRVVCIHSARSKEVSAIEEAATALYETQISMNHARFFQHQLDDITQSIWEPFSLEFYSASNIVYPCIVGSHNMVEHLSNGIYAWMEGCEVEEVRDHAPLPHENLIAVGAELRLRRSDIFPIKFNGEFLTSTLAPVLTTLSQTIEPQRLLVQTIVKPLRDTWWHHLRLASSRRLYEISASLNPRLVLRDGLTADSRARIRAKCSSPMFAVNIRISAFTEVAPGASSETRRRAASQLLEHVHNISSAAQQFNRIDENGFVIGAIQTGDAWTKKVRSRAFDRPFRLSSNELAGFFNPPSAGTLINGPRALSRKGPAPADIPRSEDEKSAAVFGHTNHRGTALAFGIKNVDRKHHTYILGRSGCGKSSLMKLLIRNDILNGGGCALVDPDGHLVDDVLKMVPHRRARDVVLFDPSDPSFIPGFNPFEATRPHLRTRAIESLIAVLRLLLKDEWCENKERIARYALLAISHVPGANILTFRRMLSEPDYRRTVVRQTLEEHVKRFWLRDFPNRHDQFVKGPITRLVTRLDDLLAIPGVRASLTQESNLLDFRGMMDSRKIILMKVSKDELGREGADVLGALLIWKIYEAAISRSDVPMECRQSFNLYIDEFEHLADESLCEVLNESRKHLLSLTLSHQHLAQLPRSMQNSIFGNFGNFITFSASSADAEIVSRELAPQFDSNDVINLPIREFYVKMCIDGRAQQAFSGRTLPLQELPPDQQCVEEILRLSRARYCIRKKRQACAAAESCAPHQARRRADFKASHVVEYSEERSPS